MWRIHPGVIAQASATVDRLTDSTFHLGVGTGENINEGPLGYNFPKYDERANRMKEALTIIRRLLSGEKLTFEGEYYSTNSAKLYSLLLKKFQYGWQQEVLNHLCWLQNMRMDL